MKTEKQINNSIYLMNIIAELYMQKHKLSIPEFLDLNSKTGLFLNVHLYSMDFHQRKCLMKQRSI